MTKVKIDYDHVWHHHPLTVKFFINNLEIQQETELDLSEGEHEYKIVVSGKTFDNVLQEDGDTIEFDSYMVQEDDLEIGQLRLLEVDNRVVVPTNTHIRVLITSGDVIHAWAIPSLGVNRKGENARGSGWRGGGGIESYFY